MWHGNPLPTSPKWGKGWYWLKQVDLLGFCFLVGDGLSHLAWWFAFVFNGTVHEWGHE
jgi:hypothetical protein